MTILQTTRSPRLRWLATVATAALLLASLAAPALAHGDHDTKPDRRGQALGRISHGLGAELAQVRAATAKYHNVEVALADGYSPGSPCVPNLYGPGAMGIHYINEEFRELDPQKPQALLYIPGPNNQLRLVGVEYISPIGPQGELPELFGLQFQDSVPRQPHLSAMHVWLWQANPAGIFAAYNPNLSCPAP